jgi:hypothetical protein
MEVVISNEEKNHIKFKKINHELQKFSLINLWKFILKSKSLDNL